MRTLKGFRVELPVHPEGTSPKEAILKNRGIDPDALDHRSFFEPRFSDLHDPFAFPGMDAAVERVLKARENRERVVVFGDYDVDGVSSTAMLVRFFSSIGIEVSYRLPHRVHDGYGMKPYFMDELAEKGVKFVVSVDCGTRDVETVRHGHSLGIDFVITDHHAVPEVVPEGVVALLNPKVPGTTYPFPNLSGSGTAFKFLQAVASKVFPPSEYEAKVSEYLDFAALGTVADMMPIVGENRTIVALGLARMKRSRSSGLRKLAEGKEQVADLIGFHIGPRLNAAGRMDTPYKALSLLLASDDRVDALLAEIEDLNARRKSSTEHFLRHALEVTDPSEALAFYESDAIEHGIIGLIAGRLTEAFSKPSIALKREGDKLVASCRAPEGFDMVSFLEEFRECFVTFGGHRQAAGFTIAASEFDAFRARAALRAAEIRRDATAPEKILRADFEISAADVTEGFVRELRSYGPYGIGFSKPAFLCRGVRGRVEKLGKDGKHLKIVSPDFAGKINAFSFGEFERDLSGRTSFDFVCEAEIERWMGRSSVVLTVRDVLAEGKGA